MKKCYVGSISINRLKTRSHSADTSFIHSIFRKNKVKKLTARPTKN